MSQASVSQEDLKKKKQQHTSSIIPRGLDPRWLDLRDSCTLATFTWVGKGDAVKKKKHSLAWQIAVFPGSSGWIAPCVWQNWTC